jgi:hypothetical protein
VLYLINSLQILVRITIFLNINTDEFYLGDDNLNFIVDQMRAMENLTKVNNTKCIKFRRKNATDLYYITIFNGSGCSAPVSSKDMQLKSSISFD